jgi:ParB-like chromosome segregation protein Spo0J
MSTHKEKGPGFNVEARSLDKLAPYARNSRTHDDAQIRQIAASIREWGFTMPILVDEKGTILAGHGRYAAAALLKLNEVPVIVADGWSEAKKRAYVIADNKLTLNGGWDSELLAVELQDLSAEGYDVQVTGFEGAELAALLGGVSDLGPMDKTDIGADEMKFLLVLEVRDESEQQKMFQEMQSRGVACKLMN